MCTSRRSLRWVVVYTVCSALRIETGGGVWYGLVTVKRLFYNNFSTYMSILLRISTWIWTLSNDIKIVWMHSNFLERTRKISKNYFFNFYFLKVDISLTMHDLNLKLHICVQDIVIERTVSQIFSKVDSSVSMKFWKKNMQKIIE